MNPAFLDDLNSRQREAVESTEGRIRVVAGAGTGKTKALTYRYAYLVNVLGIDPANILCLTFTNKAAAEMRQRIALMVHSGDYNDFVCTIHGFCVKFLRKEIYRIGYPKNFTILDEDDTKALAKQSMDELGIKRTEKTVKNFLEAIGSQKALEDYITTFLLPGAKVTDEMKKSAFGNYVSRQVKLYALDFDDITNITSYILDRFEDAREKWQNELNYIMVDEAQDCNADDWNIIEKLSARHRNLFIVGDPDQAIYEWRGAKPARFVDFASDKDIILDENYRSTPKILDVANCVISANKNRIPKDLFTRKEEGRAVIHFHGKTEKEEVEWIGNQIKTLMENAGAKLSDFAILYRSSYLSRAIEQQLLAQKLTYTIWGGTRFFERKEIKDAISYLKLIANNNDDVAFERIINVPSRKLGKVFMSSLKATAEANMMSLYNTLRAGIDTPEFSKARPFVDLIEDCITFGATSSISDLLNRVLDFSGLKKALREDQDEDRLENIDELVSSVRFYEETHAEDGISLSDYLQDIALYTNQDYRKDSPTIKLMTIHQAKGLEFPYVFVTGLSEGIFPSMRTIREYKKNGEEEERRLMYVAITRAEKALFLTESEGFNLSTKMNKYPSRFLSEIKRNMFVTEGYMPEELWRGTRNFLHVLDEEVEEEFPEKEEEGGLKPGTKVEHHIFGTGTILSSNKENTTYEVKFDRDGAVRFLRATFLKTLD